MQSRWPQANKPNDASDKPGEEWPSKSSSTTGVDHIGVKGIEVRKVINQIFYVTYVIIGIGLSEPDPVINKNLVIRQGHAYVQRDATEGCQNYAHYDYWGQSSFLLRTLLAHLKCPQMKYLASLNILPIISIPHWILQYIITRQLFDTAH